MPFTFSSFSSFYARGGGGSVPCVVAAQVTVEYADPTPAPAPVPAPGGPGSPGSGGFRPTNLPGGSAGPHAGAAAAGGPRHQEAIRPGDPGGGSGAPVPPAGPPAPLTLRKYYKFDVQVRPDPDPNPSSTCRPGLTAAQHRTPSKCAASKIHAIEGCTFL